MMRRRLSGAVLLAMLGGCAAVGPDYQAPAQTDAQTIAAFPSAAALGTANAVVVSEPPEQWWQALHDPDLDALITQALAANTDLMVAIANVEAARAQLNQAQTRELPTADVDGTLRERRDAQAAQRKADAHNEAPTRSLATIGASLLWEIDLFGRVRRSVEAAAADLGSLEAVRNNVLRSLLSTVASSYIDLRGAQLRLDVAERNVAVQQQTLDLVLLLNKEGAATELDVARARTQLLTSQSTIPVQRAVARAALNRLTTLLSQPPGALDAQLTSSRPLPTLPELVAVGQPADLLRRRPDIQAAERALAAASARIGVATADLFPTVSLIGGAGVSASPIGNLAAAGAPFFTFGPALHWNIFDREAIYARIAQADSSAAADLARYQATVTQALEEVDSAVSGYGNERERQAQLIAAVAASRDAAQLAELRFKEGAEDFLTVLDAERSLLQLEDQQAVSAINVAQRLVDIQRALGGGWQNATLPAYQGYQAKPEK
jgi:multidrug efflux system outer membrane protein